MRRPGNKKAPWQMSTRKQDLDKQLVRDLAAILDENSLTEIEIEHGELRIKVSRQAAVTHASFSPPPAVQAPSEPQGRGGDSPPEPDRSTNAVRAPMVGTAYSAASPGSRPFIEVGQIVGEGETLLIIEAMKTMNQIPSPRAGTIKEILFVDGQPVEYGEPLVILE